MFHTAFSTGARWLGLSTAIPPIPGTALAMSLRGRRASVLLILMVGLGGCRQIEPRLYQNAYPASGTRPDGPSLLPRAWSSLDEGHRLEHRDSDESVDRYYEAAVYAFAGWTVASAAMGPEHPDALRARDLYNESLRDCLRTAQEFGRIDPSSHLLVNTPAGSQIVPIVHRGFVWQATDFVPPGRPDPARPKPQRAWSEHREARAGRRCRRGPSQSESLDLGPFLAARGHVQRHRPAPPRPRRLARAAIGHASPADVLEFHDPLRVATVAIGGNTVPLAGNFGAANALAHQISATRGPFALAGFALPARCSTRPTSGCSSRTSRARSRCSSSTACSTIRSSSPT